LRHKIEDDSIKVRAENIRLQQELDAANAGRQARVEAEVMRLLGGDLARLRLESARLHRQLEEEKMNTSRFMEISFDERNRKAAERDLAKLTKVLGTFLAECFQALSGCRNACARKDAVERLPGLHKAPPPPMFDPMSQDLRSSLMMIPDVLRYIEETLAVSF
jgi:hypothetical protein